MSPRLFCAGFKIKVSRGAGSCLLRSSTIEGWSHVDMSHLVLCCGHMSSRCACCAPPRLSPGPQVRQDVQVRAVDAPSHSLSPFLCPLSLYLPPSPPPSSHQPSGAACFPSPFEFKHGSSTLPKGLHVFKAGGCDCVHKQDTRTARVCGMGTQGWGALMTGGPTSHEGVPC